MKEMPNPSLGKSFERVGPQVDPSHAAPTVDLANESFIGDRSKHQHNAPLVESVRPHLFVAHSRVLDVMRLLEVKGSKFIEIIRDNSRLFGVENFTLDDVTAQAVIRYAAKALHKWQIPAMPLYIHQAIPSWGRFCFFRLLEDPSINPFYEMSGPALRALYRKGNIVYPRERLSVSSNTLLVDLEHEEIHRAWYKKFPERSANSEKIAGVLKEVLEFGRSIPVPAHEGLPDNLTERFLALLGKDEAQRLPPDEFFASLASAECFDRLQHESGQGGEQPSVPDMLFYYFYDTVHQTARQRAPELEATMKSVDQKISKVAARAFREACNDALALQKKGLIQLSRVIS